MVFGFRVKLLRFIVNTWTGIFARTGVRKIAEEWLIDSGILWSKIGSVMRRFQIRTNEVRCRRVCAFYFSIYCAFHNYGDTEMKLKPVVLRFSLRLVERWQIVENIIDEVDDSLLW